MTSSHSGSECLGAGGVKSFETRGPGQVTPAVQADTNPATGHNIAVAREFQATESGRHERL